MYGNIGWVYLNENRWSSLQVEWLFFSPLVAGGQMLPRKRINTKKKLHAIHSKGMEEHILYTGKRPCRLKEPVLNGGQAHCIVVFKHSTIHYAYLRVWFITVLVILKASILTVCKSNDTTTGITEAM